MSELSVKNLVVVLVVWSEMSTDDFQRFHHQRMREAMKEGFTEPQKGVELYKTERDGLQGTLYATAEGLRLLCFAKSSSAAQLKLNEAKTVMRHLERQGLETLKSYFREVLGKRPVWVYFYPIWYIDEVKPDYVHLEELFPVHDAEIERFVEVDLEELRTIYPFEVTTPEIATEVLPISFGLFDPVVGREALFRIYRGLTLIVGSSEDKVSWFARTVHLRIEPRPYVSFGNILPKAAESISDFPVVERVQLTSGKGWIDNMIILEEALEREIVIGRFVESARSVKEDILLALAGVFAGIMIQLVALRFDVGLVILTVAFLTDACLMGFGKMFDYKFPRPSRTLRRVAGWFFYLLLPMSVLYVALVAMCL